MKKLGNAILMIDVPFNIVGIILCVWRINIMLHSDLQRLIDEEGGIGTANTLIVVGAVCCCMFLVLNIICAVGRARNKESMIAEGMTGISFLIKNLMFYSFLIAASGLSFIARFAGKYPASTPTSTANTMDISTSHHGI